MRVRNHSGDVRESVFAVPMLAGGAVVVMLGVLAAAGCGGGTSGGGPTPMTQQEIVARGEYLVNVGACDDCHTPLKMGPQGPAPDMTRRLSGHPQEMVMPPAPDLGAGPWGFVGAVTSTAYFGPWGTTFAANLTPSETGLKGWTDELFLQTFHTQKHWGTGRPILPPMPILAYSHYPDEDLLAIWAYLNTLPPIDNQVPAYIPPAGGMEGGE